MTEEKAKPTRRSYWLDEVFVDYYAWCWATERILVDDDYADFMPICLGRESEIVPILKGDKPIPEDVHPRRRAILVEILAAKEKENERVSKPTPRAARLLRARPVRNPRHTTRNARRAS